MNFRGFFAGWAFMRTQNAESSTQGGKAMDKLIFAVLCFAFAVVFFTGKGAQLISGKKDSSENEQVPYNSAAISKAVGIVLLAAAVCFLAIYLVGVFLPKYLVPAQAILGLILTLLGIFSIIFINKSPRFRK